ncbi:MAG: TIGR04086 family membrane protein [Lachnospiraceae bacterium]|jgi:putative membrane protein (TIGR04086 family)|nr:TIGR04086 family membrane protein [Lachnospiraceae bacterium]
MEKKLLHRATKEEGKLPIPFLLKCLLFSYIITGGLLLLLALLLYVFNLSEKVVSAGVIVLYVVSTFFAGYMAGKKLKNKKFLWGLILGVAYFFILLLMSLFVNRSIASLTDSFFSTLVLCVGGGMLGGMMS